MPSQMDIQQPVQMAGKHTTTSGSSDASCKSNYRRTLETEAQSSSHPKANEEDSTGRDFLPWLKVFYPKHKAELWVNYRLPERCLIQNQKAETPEGKNARANFMITSNRCKKTWISGGQSWSLMQKCHEYYRKKIQCTCIGSPTPMNN